MKRSRLPAAFVVTVSAIAAGGCHTEEPTTPPPQEPQWNPPPPPSEPVPVADADVVALAPPPTPPLHGNPPPPTMNPPPIQALNAVDPKTNLPILKMDTGCEVDPGLDSPRGRGVRPASHAVKCPDAMNDPAWSACLHGTLYAMGRTGADGGAVCTCNNHGNPPLVTDVACPRVP